jgi:hypothetical protein
MVRRSRNTHQLKVDAHPHRVEILDVEVRPYLDGVSEAAERAGCGHWYSWLPSRPWPPVMVFAFQEEAHRDAFAAWLAETVPTVAAAPARDGHVRIGRR